MGKFKLNHLKPLVANTTKRWLGAEPFRQSALIPYYAIFSIPGLLIIIIWAAGAFFGEEAVRGELTQQIGGAMGPEAAKGLENLVYNAYVTTSSWVMKIVGIGALIFGASTLFFQLQNFAWHLLWNGRPHLWFWYSRNRDPDHGLG